MMIKRDEKSFRQKMRIKTYTVAVQKVHRTLQGLVFQSTLSLPLCCLPIERSPPRDKTEGLRVKPCHVPTPLAKKSMHGTFCTALSCTYVTASCIILSFKYFDILYPYNFKAFSVSMNICVSTVRSSDVNISSLLFGR